MSYTPRLKEDYSNKIVNELKDKLQLDNIMQVPVLEKIVIHHIQYYKTSGARDTIFINCLSLNSLATGPNTLVPLISPV